MSKLPPLANWEGDHPFPSIGGRNLVIQTPFPRKRELPCVGEGTSIKL